MQPSSKYTIIILFYTVFVPKKNPCTKDEISKKLVETQNTVSNTISAKSNNQEAKTLNQSNSSLHSNSLHKKYNTTNQLVSQRQQDPPIALTCSAQLQIILHPIQVHHQRSEENIAM